MILTIAKYLWIAGSLPFIILGSIHLYYTFFSNKFSSRTASVDDAMKNSFPVLTKETTMWKAWIGFNGSHSSGVIYIGLINFIAAISYPEILFSSLFLALNIITVLFYSWLGKKYWFGTPFKGVLIATGCFVIAAILVFLNR